MAIDDGLQTNLAFLNRRRLSWSTPSKDWLRAQLDDLWWVTKEGDWLEELRVCALVGVDPIPTDVDGFIAWFEALENEGPHITYQRRLFDHLAEQAPADQFRWFVQQEAAGEAGFDDLVALTQLRMPVPVKLEMAKNYWDEMGCGREQAMHGPMLGRMALGMGVVDMGPSNIVPEALAVGNLLTGLAYNRRYAWQSFGALGAVELTAPGRAEQVVEGMKRLGVDPDVYQYFQLHSTIDRAHWKGWRDNALRYIVLGRPDLIDDIAEGALMRLEVGRKAYDRYLREFSL